MISFEVKASHIRLGKKQSMSQCAIALAVLERIDHAQHVWVGLGVVKIGSTAFYMTPEIVDFINAFDAGKKVYPCSFTLKDAR